MAFSIRSWFTVSLAACLVGGAFAQPPAGQPTQPAEKTQAAPKQPDRKPGEPKPYAEVVTKDAVTQQGMFKVHRIEDKVLWEIPSNMLGRELLWQTEVAEVPRGVGYPGTAAGVKVIRFTRRNNKIFMRAADHGMRTNDKGGLKTGVEMATVEPIIQAFDVQAEGEGKSAVIEVTQLFTSDPQDFAVKGVVGGSGVDPSKSYIDRVKAFPTNIETRSLLTFMAGGAPSRNPFGGGGGARNSTLTVTVHYSLVALPEKPMMPRYRDSRVGFFGSSFQEYGAPQRRVVEHTMIDRFRLEKKNPNEAVSEPIKPIVYYLSREVPEQWRPYLKKAVEDWQVAFEQAGFRHAIICKDAPTKEEDPTWDPEDARYSVIRWAPSPVENAMGPSIQDPRSGETISAHVIVWHNILQLVENWYFVQCGAIDPRAKKIPFPDDLMGELMYYVVVHEVGHTLGLEHNFKASSHYTAMQLRDPAFTNANGVSASIMDYSRFNYVAQPGDGVTRRIGFIGPYDKFAIEYGYKPIAGARTPADETPELDRICARQVNDPRLRFGNSSFFDPTVRTEDIGADPLECSKFGLMNIERIAENLMAATSKFGESYESTAAMYGELMGQRSLEMNHVMALVGGIVETDYHAGRGGAVFQPVDKSQQRGAVMFVLDNSMKPGSKLFSPELLNRFRPTGYIDGITGMAGSTISSLLGEARIKRMFDNQAVNGASAYTVKQMLDDITSSVWSELSSSHPMISVYRRTVQRAFLKTMNDRLNGASATNTDLRFLAKDMLRSLARSIDKAIPKAGDAASAGHLADCRKDIERILDNKYPTPVAGAPASPFDFLGVAGDGNRMDCFRSYSDLMNEIQP